MSLPRPARDHGPAYRTYALGLLWAIYAVHSLDRSILLILAEPIRREFVLSDSQIGLLTGLGYALPFALAGAPLGALTDHVSRKRLLAVLVAAWSAVTAASGLVRSFPALLAARAAVGATEAGAPSTILSLISDIVPPRLRALALGVYYTGPVVGLIAGSLLGGAVAAAHGWRSALLVAALPGVAAVALLLTTLREPFRGRFGAEASPGAATASLGEIVAVLRASAPLRAVLAGLVLGSLTLGANFWMPAFLMRSLHLTMRQAGPLTALGIGLPGGLGALAGGLLSQRFGGEAIRRLAPLCATSLILAVPVGIVGMLAGQPGAVLAGVAGWSFVNALYTGPGYSLCLGLTPPAMRGSVLGVVIVASNVLGAGLGPLVVGALSDAFHKAGDAHSLAHALACVLLAGLAAGTAFLAARPRQTV